MKIEDYKDGFYLKEVKNDKDRENHEMILYKAFYEKYPWYAEMCFDLKDKRLIPKVGYGDDHFIFHLMHDDEIVSVGSILFDYKRKFEIELMGFKIEKNYYTCEGLHIVSDVDNKFSKLKVVSLMLKINKKLNEIIKSRGFSKMYSSCEESYQYAYKALGFKAVSDLMINGSKEILLLKEI